MSYLKEFPFYLCFIGILSCHGDSQNQDKIAKIEIRYIDYWFITMNPPLNCKDLMAATSGINKVSITDPVEIKKWLRFINSLSPVKWKGNFEGDCRICCTFLSADNKIIMTIALWPTGFKIDSSVFQQDSLLLQLVEPYLPEGYYSFTGKKLLLSK